MKFLHKILRNELIRKSLISFIFKVVGYFLGYFVTFLITSKYGVEGYGLYALSIAIINIAILAPKMGLDNSVIKLIATHTEEGSKIINSSLILTGLLSIVFAFIVFAFSKIIANDILKIPSMFDNLHWIALTILPLTFTSVLGGVLRGRKSTTKFMILIILPQIILVILLSGIIKQKNPVQLFSISYFITLIVAIIFIRKDLSLDGIWNFKNIFILSIPMMLTSSMIVLITRLDVVMIGSILNVNEVGIYTVAVKISTFVNFILMSVNVISAPMIVEKNKISNDALKSFIHKTTLLIGVFTILTSIFLIVFSSSILGLFGPEFNAGKSSLCILILGQTFACICGTQINLLQMTGSEKYVFKVMIIALLLNIILNSIFIPLAGRVGASIASAISLISWNVILLIKVRKKFGFWMFGNPYRIIKRGI